MERRVWKLKAPAYGLNDAPVAFHRSLKSHLLNKELFREKAGLHCVSSAFDPCLFFIFNGKGPAVGAFTTHIDDILGCGEPGVMEKLRQFLEFRFGELKLQEKQFVHVGMELSQDSSFSVTLTQKEFTEKLKPLGTSPRLWAARQKL